MSVYNRCVICTNMSVCIEWCTVGGGCYCVGGLGCVAQYTHAIVSLTSTTACYAQQNILVYKGYMQVLHVRMATTGYYCMLFIVYCSLQKS